MIVTTYVWTYDQLSANVNLMSLNCELILQCNVIHDGYIKNVFSLHNLESL
jgi:hypothetical protein